MRGLEGEIDLGLGFADARKNHAARHFRRGGEHALQFAAGDDVEAGAALGQQPEDGQRGVGLDRVADEVVAIGEGVREHFEPLDDLVG